MAKKTTENKVEEKLTYDQLLLRDIKFNEEEIIRKSKEIENHKGALDYARYAYDQYMKSIQPEEKTE
jgi:hypothetical protein